MTRNTFLATIAALFTAPFIGKRENPIKAYKYVSHATMFGLPPRSDMQFIESHSITGKEIARIYKLPEELIKRGYTYTMTPNKLRELEGWK